MTKSNKAITTKSISGATALRMKKRTRTQIECSSSRTEQHHKNNCDINLIVARGLSNGGTVLGNAAPQEYLDLSSLPDYQSILNQKNEADAAFRSLPAEVRKEFDHNPGKLLEFLSKEENLERARELGLVAPAREPEPPIEVKVINPPPIENE